MNKDDLMGDDWVSTRNNLIAACSVNMTRTIFIACEFYAFHWHADTKPRTYFSRKYNITYTAVCNGVNILKKHLDLELVTRKDTDTVKEFRHDNKCGFGLKDSLYRELFPIRKFDLEIYNDLVGG